MAKALAFFPWLESKDAVEIGPIRLIPWAQGTAPGDLRNANQLDIDAVIGAYADRPNHPRRSATLLELGEWRTGDDTENDATDIFLSREMICVSALSKRRLFVHSHDYCNSDLFTLVLQKYEQGHGGNFAFSTRRRDGGTNQFWSSSEFAFCRPHHVPHRGTLNLDTELLRALADTRSVPIHIVEAIREFNLANTDSNNVVPHVEIVMLKSAFEFLFEIDQKERSFTSSLKEIIPQTHDDLHIDPMYVTRWTSRFPNAERLIECWGKEFCDIRGQSAHGGRKDSTRFVWNEFWHLAFASVLFPIALKLRLEKIGLYALSALDHANNRAMEQYLTVNPIMDKEDWYSEQHPWPKIYQEALINSML